MRRCIGDLEANGLLDTATVVHCGVFKDIETDEVFQFRPHQIQSMLTWLNSEVDTLIMHNGIDFDMPLLRKLHSWEFKGRLIDTLVMSKVLQPKRPVPWDCPVKNKPHSVETWGYRVGRGKPEHNDWDTFSEAMLHRCTEDVHITHMIYNALVAEMEHYGGWTEKPYRPMDMVHQLFTILEKQERHGWLFDREHADKCIQQLTKMIDKIAEKLQPMLPLICVREEKTTKTEKNLNALREAFNAAFPNEGCMFTFVAKPFKMDGKLNSTVQKWLATTGHQPAIKGPFSRVLFRPVDIEKAEELKNLLLSLGWEPAQWNTDKEGNQTSPKLSKDDPFHGLKSGIGKMIAKRVQAKHRRSNIEGWIALIRPDGRISARVSGLANTYRATHAGIVNVPGSEAFFGKQMRKCFTCPEGKVIVGTDSAGCQNRMLAARVGDEFFTRTLLEGKKSDKTSIHFVNQAAIKKVAGIDVSYHESKTLNYAALFGASHAKLGRTVGGGKELGEKIQAAIYGVAPGFQALVDNLKEEWKANAKIRRNKWGNIEYYDGWIRGLDGRPVFIESEHAILVYVLQSDEAIMMALAYCKLYADATKKFGPFGKRWAFLIWYHDEIQSEVDEDIAEDFAKLAENAIVWAGEFYKISCPHKGESDIGKNWYETH